ncbi:hypothetical protein ABIA39_001675 [Nocardia sp. GAS34]|uniref:hypothetical protein n=1 Tax=unclassified Nocardia TaxID=2637762 RepID=UPI003D23CB58
MTGHVGFAYAVDGQLLVFHTDNRFDIADLDDHVPSQQVRAAAEAAGTVDAAFDDGITMRMICALAGLPRTLDELRDVPLVIAPHE